MARIWKFPVNEKVCKRCGRTRFKTFYRKVEQKGWKSTDGLRAYCCLICETKLKKQLTIQNRKELPEIRLFKAAKSRATRTNMEFNITIEDILIPEICPVFGMKLQVNEEIQKDNSYSLDRIINSKGYIKGNVIVVSRKANRLKNNADADELLKLAHFYKELEVGIEERENHDDRISEL